MAEVPKIGIMVSSTREDLQAYRDAASEVIRHIAADMREQVHLVDKSMEFEAQSGEREWSVDLSKGWVEQSDWIVLVVGFHYGSVSRRPEDQGLSHTEWEYRHAAALAGKKIFVFMAGEPGSVKPYRAGDGEPVDLLRWRDEPDRDRLQRFREQLQPRAHEVFDGLPGFRAQLESCLRQELANVLPRPPGGALARLVAAADDATNNFMTEVQRIRDFKAAHDHLHELLETVIRAVDEEVLPAWREQQELSDRQTLKLMARLGDLREHTGALRELVAPFAGRAKRLGDLVRKVIDGGGRLRAGDLPLQPLTAFEQAFMEFSEAVRTAFDAANRHMMDALGQLRPRRDELLRKVSEARLERPLSFEEDRQLDGWLGQVDAMLGELSELLARHDAWQTVHQAFEGLDGWRGRVQFPSKLSGFCDDALRCLDDLVDAEIERLGKAAPAAEPGPEAGRCRDAPGTLKRLAADAERLDRSRSDEDLITLRARFDAAFYCLDKRTQEAVEAACARVASFKVQRDRLLETQRAPRGASSAARSNP